MSSSRKAAYFRRRGWKDLILLFVVFLMGLEARHLINMREAQKRITDYEKWQRRPKLGLAEAQLAQAKPGESGLPPCFFVASSSPPGQNIVSGSVGDCVLLLPDGKQWNFYEVNLRTGAFVPVNTDMYVADTMPLAFTRITRRLDRWSRVNQIYLVDVYEPYLLGGLVLRGGQRYASLLWSLPDGQVLDYKRISPGTGFGDALFEHSRAMPLFGGPRIAWNGWGWDVSLADGETYLSPEAHDATRPLQSSLVGIFDRNGNEIRLTREENGNLTEIRSPSGYWIRITYAENRINRVASNSGDYVDYEYDPSNRLLRTHSSRGPDFEYLYDSGNRILRVANSKRGVILNVFYDSRNRVGNLVLADHRTLHFDYTSDLLGNVTEADVTGPRSEVARVKLHGDSYSIEQSP